MKRRVSYTPIMLTSKSIKPLARKDCPEQKRYRPFEDLRKQHAVLNFQYPIRREHPPLTASSPNRHHDFSWRFNIPTEQDEEEEERSLNEQKSLAAVVTMEFSQEAYPVKGRRRRRLISKTGEVNSVEINEVGDAGNKPAQFHLVSNAKTYDNFTKMLKIKPQKVEKRKTPRKEETQSQWNDYLNKYYLSVKKVHIPAKKESITSAQANMSLTDAAAYEVQKYERQVPPARLDRYKSSSSMPNGEKQKDLSECYGKIEADIMQRRSNLHKKNHFIFGMADSGKSAESLVKAKFDAYKDFLWKVNYSNGLYVKAKEESERTYKVYVGFGNNSGLIKGLMRRRFWWQVVEKPSEDTNLAWTQLKSSESFARQPSRLEGKELRKKLFCRNIQDRKEEIDVEQFEKNQELHERIMKGWDLKLWTNHYIANARNEQKISQSIYIKRFHNLIKKKPMKMIENNEKMRVHNHFECNYYLGNKKAMFYCLRQYYTLQGKDPFDFLPLTFHISKGISDTEFERFLIVYYSFQEKQKYQKDLKNIWIVKPGQFTNRGKGITVCATLDQIKIRLRGKEKAQNGHPRTYIVQKYIEKPLLYNRRKFDLRHYMLMTCVNGSFKGYWYSEGYVRTTSSEYNIKNCKDLFTHLTNDAVQQHGQDYGKYEKGNKVSYADFQKYLKNVDFQGVLSEMKALGTDCMRATYHLLEPHRKEHNFELFGLDFMLDEDLRTYLIQVNTNPCLETSCPILNKVITGLIDNVLKICVDPLFPPPHEWLFQKKYQLGQKTLEENKFTLVFDEKEDALHGLPNWRDRLDMGLIDEEEEEYHDEEDWNDENEDKL